MAKIMSTVSTGKDENFEMVSKKIKEKAKILPPIKQEDPRKVCMTRTIVPNKRPTTKEDIKNFVKRIRGEETNEKTVEVTDKNKNTKMKNDTKVEVDKVDSNKKEERKSRGRPRGRKKKSSS